MLGAHPIMNEADIWRTANELIRDYGMDAERCARFRAGKLREEDMADGAADWDRIAAAIVQLKRDKPGNDEPVN